METVYAVYLAWTKRVVWEELYSMETHIFEKIHYILCQFEKNYIVWKQVLPWLALFIQLPVWEELYSMETFEFSVFYVFCDWFRYFLFEKNYIVWKHILRFQSIHFDQVWEELYSMETMTKKVEKAIRSKDVFPEDLMYAIQQLLEQKNEANKMFEKNYIVWKQNQKSIFLVSKWS